MESARQSVDDVAVVERTSVDLPPARPLVHPREVLQARRLQAREYVRIGYLPGDCLAADGTVKDEFDPWVPYSRYFGALDDEGTVRATMRLIGNHAPTPLPTLELPGIDPEARERLAALPTGRLAEISALARDREVGNRFTRAAFHATWVDALASGTTDLVLNVDDVFLQTLHAMGRGLFHVIGTGSPAPVRPVLPVWTRPADFRSSTFTDGVTPDPIRLP